MVGPRRSASWVWHVLNPWSDALERDLSILQRENPSVHYQLDQLVRVRPLAEYLDPSKRNVARDCRRNNPDIDEAAAVRDLTRQTVENAAVATRDTLASDAAFQRRVRELFSGRTDVGAYAADSTPRLIASYVVNNAHELPSSYTHHAFWQQHGAELRQLREGVPSFHELRLAIDGLTRVATELAHLIDERRNAIMDRFDIPADEQPGLLAHDSE